MILVSNSDMTRVSSPQVSDDANGARDKTTWSVHDKTIIVI